MCTVICTLKSHAMNKKQLATIHYAPDVTAIVDLCTYSKYKVARGDMVINTSDSEYGYRSCGMYFFNGKTLVKPCTEYDDYGTVPSEFDIITEFPPGYWDLPVKNSQDDNNNGAPLRSELHYERGRDGSLIVVPRTERKMYWHHPENCGISPLVIDEQKFICVDVTKVDDDIVIVFNFNGTNYALISDGSMDDTKKSVKTRKWWVYSASNVTTGSHTDLAIHIKNELDVDMRNILRVDY